MPIIPATQQVEIVRITLPGHSKQKVSETPFHAIKKAWWYTLVIPATQEAEVRGSLSKGSHRKKCRPYPKNN
jgi:hypothetical protein